MSRSSKQRDESFSYRAALLAMGNAALVPPASRVLLAVSGGADSMALLGWMMALRHTQCVHASDAASDKKRGDEKRAHAERGNRERDDVKRDHAAMNLVVAHVNHGLRGGESDGDEAFVQARCEKIGVPFVVERIALCDAVESANGNSKSDGEAHVSETHVSEDRARRARYASLVRMARACDCSLVATGHTMSDSLESMLLFWLRGATVSGWCGIREQRELARGISLVRPLLRVSRDETRRWCREMEWPWREDASNTDAKYKRNRVRNELLPLMCDLAARDEAVLARQAADAANILGDDLDCLDALAQTHLETLTLRREPQLLALDGLAFRALPLALQRRVLRKAAQQVQVRNQNRVDDAPTVIDSRPSGAQDDDTTQSRHARAAKAGVFNGEAHGEAHGAARTSNPAGVEPRDEVGHDVTGAFSKGAGGPENEGEDGNAGTAPVEISAQHIEAARRHIASDGRRAVWSWRGGLRVEWTGAMAGNRIRVWLVEIKARETGISEIEA